MQKTIDPSDWRYKFIMWIFPTTTFWHPTTTCSLNIHLIIGMLFSPFVAFEFLCNKLMMLGRQSTPKWSRFYAERIIVGIFMSAVYLLIDFLILIYILDWIGCRVQFMGFLGRMTNFAAILFLICNSMVWGFMGGVMMLLYVTLKAKFCKPVRFKKPLSPPRLKNPRDWYYEGVGPNWGVDLDGNRFFKIYDPKYLTSNIGSTMVRFAGKINPGDELTNELLDSVK